MNFTKLPGNSHESFDVYSPRCGVWRFWGKPALFAAIFSKGEGRMGTTVHEEGLVVLKSGSCPIFEWIESGIQSRGTGIRI